MTLQNPHASPSSQRPDSELPQDRLRWSALACAALLSACASTPLPPWPTTSKPQDPAPPRPAPATPVVPQATTQPIAPANNLVPLPYNAAGAARFPDPATRYDTPGLAPQRNQFGMERSNVRKRAASGLEAGCEHQCPPAVATRSRGSTAKYSRSTARLITTKMSAIRHR